MLSYARDYRLIEFVCKHFDWIYWQVFLVETKHHLDMGQSAPAGARHWQRSPHKPLIVNEHLTCVPLMVGAEKSGAEAGRVGDSSHFLD